MAQSDRPLTLHGPVLRSIAAGYVILAIGVTLGLYLSYHASQRAKQNANCISDWANASSARGALLTERNTARLNRLDTLIRDVAKLPRERSKFRRDIELYIVASDAYNRALDQHPSPTPPAARC